jgi:superfamily II DNA or RNA helicase
MNTTNTMNTIQAKLNKRINDMIEYESDQFLVNINLKQEVSDKLFDYQILHVFNMITAFRSFNILLDGSDTGTGKTFSGIAVCKQLNLQPFIICNKIGIKNWQDVCKIFNVNPITIINYETIRNGKFYNNNKLTDCEYFDLETHTWKLPRNSIVIFDEVHKCKNQKTANGQLLMSTKTGKFKVLMLSATISDTPKAFNIFGYMLDFYKKMSQANNWIKGMLREDMGYIGDNKNILSAINKNIYPFRGSRMRIAELGNRFPQNQVSADCYNISKEKEIEVNQLFEKIHLLNNLLKSSSNSNNNNTNNGKFLADIIKVRQLLESIRNEIFVELVNEYLDNGYSVVIFVNFTKTIHELSRLLNTTCIINGEISYEQQIKNTENFQNNSEKVIICNIKAGSASISLHDLHGVPRVSLISPTFSSTDIQQALGRISRIGAKTPALQRIIYCANTCEEVICERVKSKLGFLSKLNDNDLINIK